MDLKNLRAKIDKIDDEITDLFVQRLKIAADIGRYKNMNNLPILNQAREDEVLAHVMVRAGADFSQMTRSLFLLMFELSRSYQEQLSLLNKEK